MIPKKVAYANNFEQLGVLSVSKLFDVRSEVLPSVKGMYYQYTELDCFGLQWKTYPHYAW